MCILHKYILKAIVYEEFKDKDYSYGVKIIEIYECSKCEKVKYKIIDKHFTVFRDFHENYILKLQNKGLEDIIKYKIKNIINK